MIQRGRVVKVKCWLPITNLTPLTQVRASLLRSRIIVSRRLPIAEVSLVCLLCLSKTSSLSMSGRHEIAGNCFMTININ